MIQAPSPPAVSIQHSKTASQTPNKVSAPASQQPDPQKLKELMATTAPMLGGDIFRPRRVGSQVWDNGTLYTWENPKGSPIVVAEQKKRKSEHRLPMGYRLAYVKDQVAYALSRDAEKGQLEFHSAFRFENWTRIGVWKSGKTKISGFRVLEGGKILILAAFEPLRLKADLGYLGILRPDDAETLNLDAIVTPSFDVWDKAALASQGGAATGWMTSGRTPILEDFMQASFTHANEKVIVVLRASGYILSLSGNSGMIQKEALLFPSVLSKDHADKKKECAILAWRAEENGDLLVASRSEDAVLNARSIYRQPYSPEDGPYVEYLNKVTAKALEAFPEILWWNFSFDGGSLVRTPTPHGMPSRLMNMDFFKKFDFHMTAADRPVLMLD